MSSGKGNREIGDPLDEMTRTGKIGGRAQPAKSPNVQKAERLNSESVESPNTQQSTVLDLQTSKISTVQPSESVKGQTMNSLEVQEKKSMHKGRTQKTIYLPPALAKQLKFASVDEEREISEIVTDALEAYFQSKQRRENI
jgi:hypothetical protein